MLNDSIIYTCIRKSVKKQAEIVTISLQKAEYVLVVIPTNSDGGERELHYDLHLDRRYILELVYQDMQILLPDIASNSGML